MIKREVSSCYEITSLLNNLIHNKSIKLVYGINAIWSSTKAIKNYPP